MNGSALSVLFGKRVAPVAPVAPVTTAPMTIAPVNRGPRRRNVPNEITCDESTATAWVILTDAKGNESARAAIDIEDVEIVRAHRWYAHRSGSNRAYVAARSPTGGMMHALLCPAPKGMEVDHIDRDALNNRRANLRPVTHMENLQNLGDEGRKGRELPRGVYAKGDRFRVQLNLDGLTTSGGVYDTVEEAESAARAMRAVRAVRAADRDSRRSRTLVNCPPVESLNQPAESAASSWLMGVTRAQVSAAIWDSTCPK